MLRKGICITAIYPEAMYDKDKLVDVIKQTAQTNFFNGVEYYFEGSEEDCKEIRDTISEHDLYSVFLAGYPMKNQHINISARDEVVRKNSSKDCKKLIKRAITLGADKVLILSGPVWDMVDRDLIVQQTVKSIQEMADFMDDKDIVPEITLEFFNNEGEPYLAVGDFETLKMLCKQIHIHNFGITYDLSHAMQLGMNISLTVKELLPWIHHIHIANSVSRMKTSPLYGDKHPLFGVDDEDLSLEDVLSLLKEFHEKKYFDDISLCSMEVIAREDHSQEWYFKETEKQARILLSEY